MPWGWGGGKATNVDAASEQLLKALALSERGDAQLEAGEFGRHSRREQFQIDLEEAMASQQTPSPPDRRRLLDDLGTRRRERLRRVQDVAAAVEAELSVVPPGPTHGSPKRISLTVEPPRSPSSTPEEGGPSRRLQPFELIAAGREANPPKAVAVAHVERTADPRADETLEAARHEARRTQAPLRSVE